MAPQSTKEAMAKVTSYPQYHQHPTGEKDGFESLSAIQRPWRSIYTASSGLIVSEANGCDWLAAVTGLDHP